MSSIYKRNLGLSIFGESHGRSIGVVIDGLPPGVALDETLIAQEMARRAASGKDLATPRKEGDVVEIQSGYFNDRTTGTPLCGMITNTNTRSQDYAPAKPRPGHADYAGHVRYNGYEDYRGGGHFSGRLTAPLVFAGAVCKQVIAQLAPSITIGSRLVSLADIHDDKHLPVDAYPLDDINNDQFPLVNGKLRAPMEKAVRDAMAAGDSVGGIIEGYLTGLPAGLGDPLFESFESELARLLFSIPAVKGVSFGLGFDFAAGRGSQTNDAMRIVGGEIVTETNHNGGLTGGITNGMPVVFQAVIKPTPSVSVEQDTVDLKTMKEEKISIHGRHDPCIVLRAYPVIEAVAAIVAADFLVKTWREN